MREIAREAGCSVMTVSLALRNSHRISADTRRHVQEVARRLGYRPNPMVSALMTHLSTSRPVVHQANIAFLAAREVWRQSWVSEELYGGVRDRAEELGFLVDKIWLDGSEGSPDRLQKILRSRNIQGAVVAPLPETGVLDAIHWEDLSSVAIGNTVISPRLHRVTNHQYHGMQLILETLRAKGYRRIGLALETFVDDKVDRTWSSGLTGYQLRWPVKERVPPLLGLIYPDDVRKWMTRHRPDVVIGLDRALDSLMELGIGIPGDVAFVHLSVPYVAFPEIDVSGLNQQWRAAAAAAVDSVVAQLYRNERGISREPKTIMLEGAWYEGTTTPGRESVR